MKPAMRAIESKYREALEEYFENADERPLLKAYELGRDAVAHGLGVLELSLIHI